MRDQILLTDRAMNELNIQVRGPYTVMGMMGTDVMIMANKGTKYWVARSEYTRIDSGQDRHVQNVYYAKARKDVAQEIDSLLKIQGMPGNWDVNGYMCGMFNGMEICHSIAEGREPKFRQLTPPNNITRGILEMIEDLPPTVRHMGEIEKIKDEIERLLD